MEQAMVTGRMSAEKKAQGVRILQRFGLNSSQAINLLFDRIVEEGNVDFLAESTPAKDKIAWKNAAQFVDSLSRPRASLFVNMTDAEIRMERLKSRGLI